MSYESYFNGLKEGEMAMSEAEYNASLAPSNAEKLTVFVLAANINGGELYNYPIYAVATDAQAIQEKAANAYYQDSVDEDEQASGSDLPEEIADLWDDSGCQVVGIAAGHIIAVTGVSVSTDGAGMLCEYLRFKRDALAGMNGDEND